jgi:uncharacterized repeat protein (TIGR03803 family)
MNSLTRCLILMSAGMLPLPAQTYTTIFGVSVPDGIVPRAVSLAQGTDGNLYGTASEDGAHGYGSFFGITTEGALAADYSFDGTHGSGPWSAAILAPDGNFYGTTIGGGENNGAPCRGTVYQMTSAGVVTRLHTFNTTGGCAPYGPLVQAPNGEFYGTTAYGGSNSSGQILDRGAIFSIDPGGQFTLMHSFDFTDGAEPWAGLLRASNGELYGATRIGGTNTCTEIYGGGCGTVFKITVKGEFTSLHSFDGTDGCGPITGMAQGSNGLIYGTTEACGAHGQGTIFQMTAGGTLTTLYNFCFLAQCADGSGPNGPLIQATDGNFYGTTDGGGSGFGTIFSITPTGELTTLYAMGYYDGDDPAGGLVQATDGNFYGTTQNGNTNLTGFGTVYRLSTGLAPFLKMVPTIGSTGATVLILGSNLTGATSVTFGSVAAEFTVVSATEITAQVPAGAQTGTVQVATPNGTLSSGGAFTISSRS